MTHFQQKYTSGAHSSPSHLTVKTLSTDFPIERCSFPNSLTQGFRGLPPRPPHPHPLQAPSNTHPRNPEVTCVSLMAFPSQGTGFSPKSLLGGTVEGRHPRREGVHGSLLFRDLWAKDRGSSRSDKAHPERTNWDSLIWAVQRVLEHEPNLT